MERDLKLLRAAASRVQQDLVRNLPASWSVSVGDDYLLTVSRDGASASAPLDPQVEDDWFVSDAHSADELSASLVDDADETVADTALDLVSALGGGQLVCAIHGVELGNCSGAWFCNGPPSHDLANVGQLEI